MIIFLTVHTSFLLSSSRLFQNADLDPCFPALFPAFTFKIGYISTQLSFLYISTLQLCLYSSKFLLLGFIPSNLHTSKFFPSSSFQFPHNVAVPSPDFCGCFFCIYLLSVTLHVVLPSFKRVTVTINPLNTY